MNKSFYAVLSLAILISSCGYWDSDTELVLKDGTKHQCENFKITPANATCYRGATKIIANKLDVAEINMKAYKLQK
jgi:hypothetical protein